MQFLRQIYYLIQATIISFTYNMFNINKILVKLFNNPIGRKYLGVPKGKKIYKITKSSAHYYTGEIAKNGMPLICTGDCSPGGRLKFFYWLENWKPIHLCWLFLKIGWKIPKYFIGADTGYVLVGTGEDDNAVGTRAWVNPTNIEVEDTAKADVALIGGSYSHYLKGTDYGFSVDDEDTVVGVALLYNRYGANVNNENTKLVRAGSVVGTNQDGTSVWTASFVQKTVGGSDNLWGTTLTPAQVNASNFGFVIQVRGAATTTALVRWAKMKVYYTVAPTTDIKSVNGLAYASLKSKNGLAKASVKSFNGLV